MNNCFSLERIQPRLVRDLYWKNNEGVLISIKEISKQRERPAKIFMFLEDNGTRLVSKSWWTDQNK